MPYSSKYKSLFIHIPKTGGTSIEKAFNIFGDWRIQDSEKLFGQIQTKQFKELGFLSNFLQHLTYTNVLELDSKYLDVFSFAFVRNPWDKMVSIYSNTDPNLIIAANKQGINLKGLNFKDFLKNVLNISHIHTFPQFQFIFDEYHNQQVNFIGRFENFESDFNKLCKILKAPLSLGHHNKSCHSDYRSYYCDESYKLVTNYYQTDIDLFSYSF